MNFGYKTLLALTLATAACWKAKAQDSDNKKDSVEIKDNKIPEAQNDSIILLDAARQDISGDSATQQTIKTETETATSSENEALQEQICQWIAEHYDCVRFIVHFESVKMNAYFDTVAKKWTIGFGNITHPNGKPIRAGDKIKDEAELMHYFISYFKNNVAPTVAKYVPNFPELKDNEKIALIDLFWNAGSGQGVLSNRKEYDPNFEKLTESQRREVAKMLREKNEPIEFEGRKYTLADIPEWRNMSTVAQMELLPLYNNNNIVKGYNVNQKFGEGFRILDHDQRDELAGLLLEQKAKKTAASKPYAIPHLSDKWNLTQVNDSTIRYQGYVATQDFTMSALPSWYQLSETQQEQVCKKLAELNGSVVYKGYTFSAKDIPLWYFLDKSEQKAVEKMLGSSDMLYRRPGDKKNKPVLANLGLAVNLHLATQNDGAREGVARERVGAIMTSFIRSRGKTVMSLAKRAFTRALAYMGKIPINGEGENAINLSSIFVGASYSLNIRDLTSPARVSDTINKCNFGKNVADTIEAQMHSGKKYPQNVGKRGKISTRQRSNVRVIRRSSYGR